MNVLTLCQIGTKFDVPMNNHNLNELKCIKDDLEDGLLHLQADQDIAWVYVASAFDELKEFISRMEKDNQTPRPVIVFRRRVELDPTDHT
jgi:hypothetical protein